MDLSFIGYEQVFYSVDRRALAKVLSLYSIPDKCIKVISAMCKINPAVVKVGNEVRSMFCIKPGVEQGCVQSPLCGSFGWALSQVVQGRQWESTESNGKESFPRL